MFYIYIYIYICASAIIFEVNRSLENFAFKMKGGREGVTQNVESFIPSTNYAPLLRPYL